MGKSSKISVFEIIGDASFTGAPRHLLTLISHLDRRRFLVSVVCPPGPLAVQLKKLKVAVFLVPMNGRADLNAIAAVQKILKKYEPDIVHTHGQRAGLIGRLASSLLPVKRIHTEHTYTEDFKLENRLLHWSHLQAMSVLDRVTHHTIAVSNAVKNSLLVKHLSKPNKTTVIYNGIDLKAQKVSAKDVEAFRTEWGIGKFDKVIGTVGSLVSSKDTTTLLRAFAKVSDHIPRTKLVIIGSGELKHFLQALASELNITDKVIFAGTIENISAALKVFNIFVLPSISEAFGIALLEAMKADLPIVATRIGGIPEILTNNLNALLVPPKSPKQLGSAILKLLNDKKLQKKFTAQYPKVLSRFTASKMAEATEKVYLEVTK